MDLQLFEGYGASVFEPLSNVAGSFSGTKPSWKATPNGWGLDSSAATGYINIDIHQQGISGNEITLEFIASRRSGGVSTAYGVCFEQQSNFAFYNDNGSGGWGLVFVFGWSTTDGQWSIAYPNANPHHYVVTYDWGSTSNNPVVVVDGVIKTVTRRISPAGSKDANTSNLKLFQGSGGTGNQWDGGLNYLRRWNRMLPNNEARQLYADPFQIYKRQMWWAPAVVATPLGWLPPAEIPYRDKLEVVAY